MLVAVYSDAAAGENARGERAETTSRLDPHCGEVFSFKMPQMLLPDKGWIISFIVVTALWFYKVNHERVPFMLARPPTKSNQ